MPFSQAAPEASVPQRVWPRSTSAHVNTPQCALHDIASTRAIEQAFQSKLPAHTLMQRAGLSVARLALALHPHAQTIWVACGPGNNGGDGLEAAIHLRLWGKNAVVTWLGTPQGCSPDTLASWERAKASGIQTVAAPPPDFDLVIDALLGIGASLDIPPDANAERLVIAKQLAHWVQTINQARTPVLAIDLPSGLNADTGNIGSDCVRAGATLSLVTLKPGLFTARGRDQTGDIWFDALGCDAASVPGAQAVAVLSAPPPGADRARAPHASHKGSFGDIAVIGGAPGMTGAALLSASAALHSGAGRVFVSLLDGGSIPHDTRQPELMFRHVDDLDLNHVVAVCGCGGGDAVRHHLARILSTAERAVLDADALNAISGDSNLQTLLARRAQRGYLTVLTPHPLEAARLLGCSVTEVQSKRLDAAHRLVERFSCCVVLKGSGSVVAAPGQMPQINPTGNALLATAGTGDVLAGAIGAALARTTAANYFQSIAAAVYRHGDAVNRWPASQVLTAGDLAARLRMD